MLEPADVILPGPGVADCAGRHHDAVVVLVGLAHPAHGVALHPVGVRDVGLRGRVAEPDTMSSQLSI